MSRAVYDYDAIDWNSLFYYDLTSKTGLRWKVDRYRGDLVCDIAVGLLKGILMNMKKNDHLTNN